ncbi:HIRAN domain-containing protein [Jannaschia marina]|uniref:HIRAN domain-containing protein n=1 Tax=Jannaschia marina TaxID=2741674 RepID=UPI0015C6CEDB|nr:HIRAN domain-containing protein [Jannaschia marina]
MPLTRRHLLKTIAALAALPTALRAAPAAPVADLCIAGGRHHGLTAALPHLGVGDVLRLRRQAYNPFDANAIEILGPDGDRLGYVPRALAAQLAGALDTGHAIVARITRFRGDGSRAAEAAPGPLWRTDWQPGDPVVQLAAAPGP